MPARAAWWRLLVASLVASLASLASAGSGSCLGTYPTAVLADSPYLYLRLDDASGATSTAACAGTLTGTYGGVLPGSGCGSYHIPLPPTGAAACGYWGGFSKLPVTGGVPSVAAGGPIDSAAWTWEAWFYQNQTGPHPAWLLTASESTSSSNSKALLIDGTYQVATQLSYSSALTQAYTTASAYATNAWTHVAATYNRTYNSTDATTTVMTLYVNGAAVGVASGYPQYHVGSVSDPAVVWGDVFVGGAYSGVNYFLGSIADVAIYPTALSSTSIAAHYAAAGGIVSPSPPPPSPPLPPPSNPPPPATVSTAAAVSSSSAAGGAATVAAKTAAAAAADADAVAAGVGRAAAARALVVTARTRIAAAIAGRP